MEKKYTFEICELKNDDATYLEFSDYLSVNKANETVWKRNLHKNPL